MLDRALAEVGLDRESVYVTNAVKHFKNEPRGKRRQHKRPGRGEIQACRWWLDLELEVVKPKLVVALGATAAFALIGRRLPRWSDGRAGLATVNPSSILRMPDEAERREAFFGLAGDLREALRLVDTEA